LRKRRQQLQAGGGDQARGHGAHAAQRACATCGLPAKCAYSKASDSTTTSGSGQHAGQIAADGAAQAEVAAADHQRQVDHVGPRHDLRDGPVLDEFLRA
jgi:hypothetical protein